MDKHTPHELTPEELAAETGEALPERAAMSTLTVSGLGAAAGTVEAVRDGVTETVSATSDGDTETAQTTAAPTEDVAAQHGRPDVPTATATEHTGRAAEHSAVAAQHV